MTVTRQPPDTIIPLFRPGVSLKIAETATATARALVDANLPFSLEKIHTILWQKLTTYLWQPIQQEQMGSRQANSPASERTPRNRQTPVSSKEQDHREASAQQNHEGGKIQRSASAKKTEKQPRRPDHVDTGLRDNFMSCCTQLAKRIPKNMLQQVTKVHFQKKDGICNLQAIVLHVRNQKKCMDPNIKSLRKWIKKHLAASGV
ncbi:C-C motif chemokine 28 [Pelobates cultripes]|uniref:C-C motif chemokine 28 n=1 Tax=Pelobates cultripes TaxID=61616 RepID=A0AAD1SBL5_PELCU|nr:C-C motif chemokine 28 [Pelobates cultripes]